MTIEQFGAQEVLGVAAVVVADVAVAQQYSIHLDHLCAGFVDSVVSHICRQPRLIPSSQNSS